MTEIDIAALIGRAEAILSQRLDEYRVDNERLRAALRAIAYDAKMSTKEAIVEHARAALAAHEEGSE